MLDFVPTWPYIWLFYQKLYGISITMPYERLIFFKVGKVWNSKTILDLPCHLTISAFKTAIPVVLVLRPFFRVANDKNMCIRMCSFPLTTILTCKKVVWVLAPQKRSHDASWHSGSAGICTSTKTSLNFTFYLSKVLTKYIKVTVYKDL